MTPLYGTIIDDRFVCDVRCEQIFVRATDKYRIVLLRTNRSLIQPRFPPNALDAVFALCVETESSKFFPSVIFRYAKRTSPDEFRRPESKFVNAPYQL